MHLEAVAKKDKEILWNVLQKYMHEMAQFYKDELDENGNYEYRYFNSYFDDNEKHHRFAEFIFDGNKMIGFALINRYSVNDEITDYCLAEFAIFPAYRNKNYAKESFKLLMNEFAGKWQIKYMIINKKAANLWGQVTKIYDPVITTTGDENILSFRV